mmetsp:Transcript_19888/g.47647  ORF Transcript_19888/g.47647 Transcript_19888/m.47647 type:complete len:111 (+) Transcript_19888:920-1252(+)
MLPSSPTVSNVGVESCSMRGMNSSRRNQWTMLTCWMRAIGCELHISKTLPLECCAVEVLLEVKGEQMFETHAGSESIIDAFLLAFGETSWRPGFRALENLAEHVEDDLCG